MSYTILTPFTLIIAILYIAIVFIDAFVFWMFTGKIGISFWKSLGAAFTANLTTAVMGLFVGFNAETKMNLIWFSVAVIVNILTEWFVYISLFRKSEISNIKLFFISLISNLIVFSVLAFLLFYKTGILTQYFDIPYIQTIDF